MKKGSCYRETHATGGGRSGGAAAYGILAVLAALHQRERTGVGQMITSGLYETSVYWVGQWLANFAACDIAYLLHFYKTGEKRAFRSFWTEGAPLVVPLAIPDFHPTKWVARSGTVI